MILVALFFVAGLVFSAAWHHVQIRELQQDINRLGRYLATYYDAEKLCELTKDMVLEASNRKVKRRPPATHLTVVKGPKQ